jgi:hypothetical protein
MSEFPPGSFDLADCIMDMHVGRARREARARRLAKEAAGARPHSQPFYCTALAGLGQRLAAWGASLQERYSTEESTPTPARAG